MRVPAPELKRVRLLRELGQLVIARAEAERVALTPADVARAVESAQRTAPATSATEAGCRL